MIQVKLFEIQKAELAIEKTGANPHFGSKYITLDSLISTITPICNSLGVLIYHHTDQDIVITTITDIGDNTSLTSSFPIYSITDPQKVGSAITYAKRYNLCQLFNIISDRDDDGNQASGIGQTKELQETAKKVFGPDDLPWIGKENIDALLKAYKSGIVPALDGDDLVRQARTKYKVSKANAEAIILAFNQSKVGSTT